MATGALPNMQAPSNGIDVSSLLKLFIPAQGEQKTTTSGGTKTQQTQLDQKTVEGLINQLLGSNQGLASVTAGQNQSGMYNSTVNTQLVNDLLSKVTTEVAAKAAPTVTTTTPQTTTTQVAPQVDPMTGLLMAGGGYVANKILKKSGIQDAIDSGIDSIGGKISDVLGFGDSSVVAGAGIANNIFGGGASSWMGDLGSAASSALGDSFSSAFSDSLGSVFDSFIGSGMGDIGSTGIVGLDAAMGADIMGGFPVLGVGMDLMQGDIGSAAATGIGFALGGPVGGVVGGLVGDIIGGGSVICTELHRQGKLSTELYKLDSKYGATKVPADVMRGYHMFGKPIAKLMAKSKLVTYLISPFALAWAKHIAHLENPAKYAPNLLGKIIMKVGVPFCKFLASFEGNFSYVRSN